MAPCWWPSQNIPYTERLFQIGDSLRWCPWSSWWLGDVYGPGHRRHVGSRLPAFWPDNDLVPLFTSSIGLLVLLLYFPGGLIQIAYAARDSVLRLAEARLGESIDKTDATTPEVALGHRPNRRP
ncbi:MAG: hypothetical protein Ct9H300mP12_15630 [Acidimicrobiales bacterium]|nr:MAG: hypothetical protein Ct9H300mP12_15630 [Acidimicrobiales bacterium]